MNANELADLLEVDSWYKLVTREEIATMLRQQQAEIEALKKDNKELHAIAQRMAMAESDARKSLQWFKEAQEMKNEPVAWAVWEGSVHDMFFTKEDADELCRLKGGDAKSVPLYTHPVKELTDEEIMVLYEEYIETQYASESNVLGFGRAILRKAQKNG